MLSLLPPVSFTCVFTQQPFTADRAGQQKKILPRHLIVSDGIHKPELCKFNQRLWFPLSVKCLATACQDPDIQPNKATVMQQFSFIEQVSLYYTSWFFISVSAVLIYLTSLERAFAVTLICSITYSYYV